MCIVLITLIAGGEIVGVEKKRIASYAKAKDFALEAGGPGRIICIKKAGKVLFVD